MRHPLRRKPIGPPVKVGAATLVERQLMAPAVEFETDPCNPARSR
jgi:hypothetical protein